MNSNESVLKLSTKMKCGRGYQYCQLPENNNRYLWQIFYIIIGVSILCFKMAQFNFFQTALFIAPIMLDIAYSGADNSLLLWIRRIFGFVNAIILMGFGGIIQDVQGCFVIKIEASYFHNFSIPKIYLGVVISLNIIVPFVYYFCAPCQKTCMTMRCMKAIQKEVSS